MYGFHGRLLHIDLSTGRSSWVDLDEPRLRAFLGGIGLGASLLYNMRRRESSRSPPPIH
jgi:aldehyde:ferredoxin oxidoreductase